MEGMETYKIVKSILLNEFNDSDLSSALLLAHAPSPFPLIAHITSNGSMASVRHLVHTQVIICGISLITHITSKRFMTSMGPLVHIQVTRRGKKKALLHT